MIKRRITILFLLVFSLGFTAQYKTVKGKNVKMSQQEMDRNAAEIVEILKFLDTDEVKQETIKAMKNKTMKYEFLTENLMLVKINNEWKVKG